MKTPEEIISRFKKDLAFIARQVELNMVDVEAQEAVLRTIHAMRGDLVELDAALLPEVDELAA